MKTFYDKGLIFFLLFLFYVVHLPWDNKSFVREMIFKTPVRMFPYGRIVFTFFSVFKRCFHIY